MHFWPLKSYITRSYMTLAIVGFLKSTKWRPSWILRSHAFSTTVILGDFMFFHSGDVREPSLKNSAFCSFFQVPSVIVLNAPGLNVDTMFSRSIAKSQYKGGGGGWLLFTFTDLYTCNGDISVRGGNAFYIYNAIIYLADTMLLRVITRSQYEQGGGGTFYIYNEIISHVVTMLLRVMVISQYEGGGCFVHVQRDNFPCNYHVITFPCR